MAEGSDAILSNLGALTNITLPPEIIARLDNLMVIFKTIGIVVLVYLVFLIVSSILNIIRNIRIKRIYKKVQEIDSKIDKLLGSKKIKQERETKKH